MALNRQTGELRLLDQSPLPNGQIPANVFTSHPDADNGYVVWTSFDSADGSPEAVLYNLATGQKTVLAQNVAGPQLSWPWADGGDHTRGGMVFENLETHQQVFLKQMPAFTALNGTSFVMSDSNGSTIALYPSIATSDQINTSYIVGESINGDFVQMPYLNDRLVTWDSNSSLFAYDRVLQRLVQLPNITGNPDPVISSHYMIWAQGTSAQTLLLYVLDTNQLPQTPPAG